ncbi:MAG: hypothetical protein AMJ79_11590, partial [Phycisphaerae bacterium SM23_30]
GGPIGVLKEGDIIEIDIEGRSINVKLSEEELARRQKEWRRPAPRIASGVLGRYAGMACSADKGAVLEWTL